MKVSYFKLAVVFGLVLGSVEHTYGMRAASTLRRAVPAIFASQAKRTGLNVAQHVVARAKSLPQPKITLNPKNASGTQGSYSWSNYWRSFKDSARKPFNKVWAKAALLLGTGVAFTWMTSNTAHAQEKKRISFTKESIVENPELASTFIGYAAKHITSENSETILAIIHLLNHNKEMCQLYTAIADNFECVNHLIIQQAIKNNSDNQLFINQLLERSRLYITSQDITAAFAISDGLIASYPHAIKSLAEDIKNNFSAVHAQILKAVLQHTDDEALKADLLALAVRHLGTKSYLTALNIAHGVILADPGCANYLAPYIVKRFNDIQDPYIPIACIQQCTDQKACNFLMKEMFETPNKHIAYTMMQADVTVKNKMIDAVWDNYMTALPEHLEAVCAVLTPADQQKLKDILSTQRFTDYIPNDVVKSCMRNPTIPAFMCACTPDNHMPTQTDKHFCHNVAACMRSLRTDAKVQPMSPTAAMLEHALIREREYACNGNYGFWHARKWVWDFYGDLYTMAHNLQRSGDGIPETFIPMNFDDSERYICCNYAMNGNADVWLSNSIAYASKGYDSTLDGHSKFSPDFFFKKFKLEKYHEQFKDDFEKAKLLHTQAGCTGSLVGIFIPKQHMHVVFPAAEGWMGSKKVPRLVNGVPTTDTRIICDALKKSAASISALPEDSGQLNLYAGQRGIQLRPEQNSDYHEFSIKTTKDLKRKVVMEKFCNPTNPAKYFEYKEHMKMLEGKLKQAIEQDKRWYKFW